MPLFKLNRLIIKYLNIMVLFVSYKNKQIVEYVLKIYAIYSLSKLSNRNILIVKKVISACIFLIFTGNGTTAQENVVSKDTPLPGEPYIQWIAQFPSAKGENKGRFKEKFLSYVFGSDNKAALAKPVAVMASDSANFWILDQENGKMIRIREGVGDIPHIRKNSYGFFTSLVGISPYTTDKILFTDSYLNKIFVYAQNKKEMYVLNDTLPLDRPTGIFYYADKQEVWVVETNAHRISVLDENGRLLRRFGTRGTEPGEFNYPTSIWIDDFGKIFIVDAMNFRIQVFTHDGDMMSVFGKTGDATGYFARPKGIATDSGGNIYVADALFNTVQIFDLQGNFLYNFGNQGRGEGEFWMPTGIYIDENDYIYVADTYNSRVQVFRLVK